MRTTGRFRLYTPEDIERIRFIRRMKRSASPSWKLENWETFVLAA
jgi:MerR HTH family regulatory protein